MDKEELLEELGRLLDSQNHLLQEDLKSNPRRQNYINGYKDALELSIDKIKSLERDEVETIEEQIHGMKQKIASLCSDVEILKSRPQPQRAVYQEHEGVARY